MLATYRYKCTGAGTGVQVQIQVYRCRNSCPRCPLYVLTTWPAQRWGAAPDSRHRGLRFRLRESHPRNGAELGEERVRYRCRNRCKGAGTGVQVQEQVYR